jgi:hypothetical protein
MFFEILSVSVIMCVAVFGIILICLSADESDIRVYNFYDYTYEDFSDDEYTDSDTNSSLWIPFGGPVMNPSRLSVNKR